MKTPLFTLLLASSLIPVVPLRAESALNEPPPGFQALFNGKDLTGWFGHAGEDPRPLFNKSAEELEKIWTASMSDVNAHWRVENGELVNDGHGLFLTTRKNFRDFELLIEYKTVPKADSGIYLRGMPQVQIWDATNPAKVSNGEDKGSGGLWNNKERGLAGKNPSKKMDRPFGQWNQFKITMIGECVTIVFNGEKVVDSAVLENYVDRASPVFAEGPIKLQTHGGEIRWRNIFIREIGPDEANQSLAGRGGDGFTRLDNGKDLANWAGATANYEIKDGALQCKAGKGGVLHTKDEFGDFQVRLEFKLPPAGNNGLAIRYPGQGDCAYTGMCEIQILDNEHPNYAKLDPRQYCGSIYGMIAAKRGFLRLTGQWNLIDVTVKGPAIKVELNGTQIVDGDVSKITDFMNGTPHPGKDRPRGFFGLAGHNDPVAFRNVTIKTL
ncbi:MAG: 3-keto-disaccharide hydrolase [Verrucomicrobiales bacterium]